MQRLRQWLGLMTIATLFASAALAAPPAAGPYKTLKSPQPVETGAKIEVIEFFWYGCPHCYELEPKLKQWVAKLPKDVEFRRVPAIPVDRWMPMARTYYTLEALGELERLHIEVFDALHRDRANLNDEGTLLDWLARKGVDRKKFSDTAGSFSVQSKVKRATLMTQAYEVDGVPALVVDGKYMTAPSLANGIEPMFGVLDSLLGKVRAERGKTAAAPKSSGQADVKGATKK